MLKIKDSVDLKILEKFGFVRSTRDLETYKFLYRNGQEDYYTETLYQHDSGANIVEIVEERVNSDWSHPNIPREIYVYSDDYDAGISKGMLDLLWDLVEAGLVEKV